MRNFLRTVQEIIFGGLLRGWPGMRCPECNVRPGKLHYTSCPQRRYGEYWA